MTSDDTRGANKKIYSTMSVANKKKAKDFLIAVAFFALSGILLFFDDKMEHSIVRLLFGFTAQIILMTLAIVWMVSINSRIVQKNIRNLLLITTLFLLFWLIIRYVKYNFFDYNEVVQRYLWYAYYIPQTIVPPIMLITAHYVGKAEDKPVDRKWWLLLIPSFIFLAMIFTNDIHQLLFRFNSDFSNWHSGYRHGATFYVVMVYEIGMIIASLIVIFHKCKVSSCHKKIWIPLVILCIGIILNSLSFLDIFKIYKIPELFCLTFAAVFESCIQIGLIPCNTRYKEFFNESGLSAMVVDNSDNVIIRSQSLKDISYENMENCENGTINIDADTRLDSSPISGGRVLWTENLKVINDINAQISSVGEQLSEENEIIVAENRLKEEKSSVEAQTQLFNNITRIVRPQLDRSAELLDGISCDSDGFEKTVGQVCVLNAYVKRRSNLEIIGAKENEIGGKELEYSIRESLDYLTLCGVSCSFEAVGEDKSNAEIVKLCYEFFEEAVEASLPTLSALMVKLFVGEESLQLRVITEDAREVADDKKFTEAVRRYNGVISIKKEDGTAYQTVVFSKEAVL